MQAKAAASRAESRLAACCLLLLTATIVPSVPVFRSGGQTDVAGGGLALIGQAGAGAAAAEAVPGERPTVVGDETTSRSFDEQAIDREPRSRKLSCQCDIVDLDAVVTRTETDVSDSRIVDDQCNRQIQRKRFARRGRRRFAEDQVFQSSSPEGGAGF